MTIRFLQTCPSENPDYPFMAGQVISVACPTPLIRTHLANGMAEAVKTDDTERAVAPEIEPAEPKRKRIRVQRH